MFIAYWDSLVCVLVAISLSAEIVGDDDIPVTVHESIMRSPSALCSSQLAGSGFHRTLSLDITVNSELVIGEDCRILVKLEVPVDVYFDVHQISMLYNSSQLSMISSDDISTELPSDLVETSHFVVYSTLEHLHFREELPIHFRYQPPCEGGYKAVNALPMIEEILLHCPNWVLDDVSESYLQEYLCWMGSATHCLWLPLEMHPNVEGEIADPPVTIPCGMQEHLGLVSFFTILIATICSVYIIYYLPVPTLDDHKHK